ncbi:phosphate acyltransferase [Sphaerisporangium corydalis]|uniref:Phosphate acyltransferase n=1 Tax=Sphaerisporangium corydalis TaxID=1441875 RepID=A0ABV9E922_9ACTN|nr:phosphate acyltransferase [Sphaerisporangium corydalis]
MTVVVVDAMGGDHGPAETVAGAVTAFREHGTRVILVGRADEIHRELARHDAAGEIEVVHAGTAVPMTERGAGAASWADSSLVVGCRLVRQGVGDAFVSAGSTGAVVACAIRVLGKAPAILRPTLAVTLPTEAPTTPTGDGGSGGTAGGGFTVLVDAGATSDPTPEMIAQFALLGAAYAQIVLRVPEPSVGLLSIGSEPGKGNRLTRAAEELLRRPPFSPHENVDTPDEPPHRPPSRFHKNDENPAPSPGEIEARGKPPHRPPFPFRDDSEGQGEPPHRPPFPSPGDIEGQGEPPHRPPFRFHGNVEGHDVLAGIVDVIVTDGFTGNVVLKNVEGTVRAALTMVAQAGIATPGELQEIAARYDPQTHGGAALLGLNGTVVVAHGSSRARTIARACVVARDLAEGKITTHLHHLTTR